MSRVFVFPFLRLSFIRICFGFRFSDFGLPVPPACDLLSLVAIRPGSHRSGFAQEFKAFRNPGPCNRAAEFLNRFEFMGPHPGPSVLVRGLLVEISAD